jgi:hypothetical protein
MEGETIKIQFVNSDWVRVYWQNKMIEEGHSLNAEAILKSLGYKVITESIKECIYCGEPATNLNQMDEPVCKKCLADWQ